MHEVIKNLNKNNIEELKPRLIRYVIQLILDIKAEEEKISLNDLSSMLEVVLIRKEIRVELGDILKAEGSKLGLLTDAFMKTYGEFTREIVEKWICPRCDTNNRRCFKSIRMCT